MTQTAMLLAPLLAAVCPAVDILPERDRYEGMNQVRAAVAIGEGMFVACSGQDNILRVYRTESSPVPVSSLDVSDFLNLEGEPADIRGAARVGDRVYWITSHSRNKKGQVEPGRYRFFATTIETHNGNVELRPYGLPCTTLLDKLPGLKNVSTLRLDKALRLNDKLSERQQKRLSPMREGLSIDALAADPRIGTLFIGFRNPRPLRVITGRPQALVIPLNNAADVVEKQVRPIFGEAMLWDFNGLGITGLQYSPVHDTYFIVAQPHDRVGPCVLYRWSGMKANFPEQVYRFGLKTKNTDFMTLGPWADIDKLSLFTGSAGSPDATPDTASFRAIWIRL